VVVVV